ncbi:MAG: SDR family oxidoreductase [bacterium]|nr:SDR family oxidoreductase [bacterium]
MINFEGKNVVVTGGCSGIGKATAIAFAEHGAKVFILDVNEEAGSKIALSGSNVHFIRTDVSKPEEVEAAYREIGSPVDILISNAGIEFNDVGNLVNMPMDKLMRIIEVNYFGAIHCVRTFMSDMPQGGKVVFVSSQQAFSACLPGTSYQSTKNALIGLMRALAIEYARKGINVNAICPGGVATEGMGGARSASMEGGASAGENEGLTAFRRLCPMGRRAWPREIALPILFLCSPWASYMTGQILHVDGGMSSVGMPRLGEVPLVDNDPDAQ